jgi:TetR/AcrR family tetracycline transcriptional repressor
VTVRAVGARLGVQAPALYWHVRDKRELLDEMATEIWRRVSAVAQAAAIGDNRFSEASRAARIDARAHPVIARGGPQIFGDPDARFTDLVSLIIATAASLRA